MVLRERTMSPSPRLRRTSRLERTALQYLAGMSIKSYMYGNRDTERNPEILSVPGRCIHWFITARSEDEIGSAGCRQKAVKADGLFGPG